MLAPILPATVRQVTCMSCINIEVSSLAVVCPNAYDVMYMEASLRH